MSSFRSRARRIAFGEGIDNQSASETSSLRSNSQDSIRSSFSQPRFKRGGIFHHSSSISEPCSCGGTATTKFSSDKAVHISPRRTNRVRKIHRSQPFELFVEALEQDGCVIVQDFVNPQIATQVQSAETVEFSPISADDNEERGREGPLDINALIRDSLLADTLYQTLSSHFLTLETISWRSKQINMSSNKPRLFKSTTEDINNLTTVSSSSSASSTTSFHRADSPLHNKHTATPKYEYQSRRDTTLGLLVPELDSLSASIPLRLIPGSHLWDDSKPDITRGVREIQLQGGEALILLGSLYHALGNEEEITTSTSRPRPGSISRTSTGSGSGTGSFRERLLHNMWMCSGVYRAEAEIELDGDDDNDM